MTHAPTKRELFATMDTIRRQKPGPVFVFKNIDLRTFEEPPVITIHLKDGQVTHLTADGPLSRMIKAAERELRRRARLKAKR